MNQPRVASMSALVAALLATGSVWAQTSNLPIGAGEASTTVNGQPNVLPPVHSTLSRAEVKAEARAEMDRHANTVQPRGEASTIGRWGQPNMAPANTTPESRVMSRAERRAERDMKETLEKAQPLDYHSLNRQPERFTPTSPTPQ